jgi:reverse transcriptase-like protein
MVMHKELKALKVKDVYNEVEELPCRRRAIQCKWALYIKWDKDGQISYFKGCLVMKQFTQIPGQDFIFTFTPVACWDSIHSILCIVTLNNWELHHIDVKNAYLNIPLKEKIYMVALEGCSTCYW